jgi:hypothetical protein
LPELRKGILPRPCQSPGNAQFVLRDGGAIQGDKKRERRYCEPETKLDHLASSTPCLDAIRSTESARVYHAHRRRGCHHSGSLEPLQNYSGLPQGFCPVTQIPSEWLSPHQRGAVTPCADINLSRFSTSKVLALGDEVIE